jgi:ParB family chromosome partitioning protein
MDQAKAIRNLVQVHGSQGEVARRLGKTPAWVSQRLALLELTAELQDQVETGELKVESARRIGRLPKERQADEARKAITAAKAPRQRRKPTTTVAGSAPAVNGVNTPASTSGPKDTSSSTVNAVNASGAQTAELTSQTEIEQPRRLPYDNAFFVVNHLHRKMEPTVFLEGARAWMKILRDEHPDAYAALLDELSQQKQLPQPQ